MNNTHSTTRRAASARPYPVALPLPPVPKPAATELRELLEANLLAMHAIMEEHQRSLETNLRALMGLRAELRALADARAPWVKALAETRALLYVALREVVVTPPPVDAGATTVWTRSTDDEV